MKRILSVFLLVAVSLICSGSLMAQPMRDEPEVGFQADIQEGQQGMRPPMPPMNRQFNQQDDMDGPRPPRKNKMQRQGGKMNPEMMKMREKREAMMAIAEAHKELARIYEDGGKIDEAAGELKKIIELAMNSSKSDSDPKNGKQGMNFMHKVIPVYTEIARLYLQHDKIGEAEKILNEGIAKFEKEDPKSATKLILFLGKIYKKNNNLEKAEETYKRVIKLNQETIK